MALAASGWYDEAMKTIMALLLSVIPLWQMHAGSNAPDAKAFVRDFYAAYKSKDAERLAQFYASDASFVDPSFELNLKGPDEIRTLFHQALAKYESLDWEIAHVTSADDDLVVEGKMIGKLGAKTVRVPFVSVFHFTQGKIAEQRDMFDVTHFLVQLGVITPPFGPKPSPTAKARGS